MISVEFQLENGHPRKHPTFCQNPLQWLLCECDQRAQETYEIFDERERVTNIQFYGQYTLMQENLTKLRVTKKAICIIDAIKVENQYAKKKLKNNYELYDIETRNTFKKEK